MTARAVGDRVEFSGDLIEAEVSDEGHSTVRGGADCDGAHERA
jgi:hypothetical protein